MGIISRSKILVVIKFIAASLISVIQVCIFTSLAWTSSIFLVEHVSGNPLSKAIVPIDINQYQSSEDFYDALGSNYFDYIAKSGGRWPIIVLYIVLCRLGPIWPEWAWEFLPTRKNRKFRRKQK